MTDRDETTGIPMDELRAAGMEQLLQPIRDELAKIAAPAAVGMHELLTDIAAAVSWSYVPTDRESGEALVAWIQQLQNMADADVESELNDD